MTTMNANSNPAGNPASEDTSSGRSGRVQSTRERMGEEVSTLKHDLEAVKHDVSSMAHSAKECAQHEAERAAELAQAGADRLHAAHTDLRRRIVRHPMASALAAVGVGVIIGRILSGR